MLLRAQEDISLLLLGLDIKIGVYGDVSTVYGKPPIYWQSEQFYTVLASALNISKITQTSITTLMLDQSAASVSILKAKVK